MKNTFGLIVLAFLSTFPHFVFSQETAVDLNQVDVAGRKFGKWQGLYPDGKVRYEGQFVHDVPFGSFSYYDREGKLKAKNEFEPGGKRAHHTAYAPNGQVIAEGLFMNQQKDSVWKFFSDIDGALLSEESYISGQLDGWSISYFPATGNIAEKTFYSRGMKDGDWKKYFENGAPMASGTYSSDLPEGEMIFYFPDSTIQIQGNYRNGLKYGVWKTWDENGNLISEEDYKEKKN